jgi:tetratricopeptide (TPR) repeat protein
MIAAFAFTLMAASTAAATVWDGDRAMAGEKYRVAITHYEAHLKDDPGDGYVMIKAARAYEGAKWWGKAAHWWDQYIAMFPEGWQKDDAKKHSADCHRWLGANYYITGGYYWMAVEELEKSLSLDPKLADAYVWLATIYQNEGMYDEALEILDKGLAVAKEDEVLIAMRKDAANYRENGGNSYVSHRSGIVRYQGGDMSGALDMFRNAAASSPDFAAAHLWTARILFEQNHFAESIPEWREALRIRPDNEHAFFYLRLAQSIVATSK